MAPELLSSNPADPSPATDVYSFGVIIGELITLLWPFPTLGLLAQQQRDRRLNNPSNQSGYPVLNHEDMRSPVVSKEDIERLFLKLIRDETVPLPGLLLGKTDIKTDINGGLKKGSLGEGSEKLQEGGYGDDDDDDDDDDRRLEREWNCPCG